MAKQTVTKTKAAPRTGALPAHLLEKYKDFAGIDAINRRALTGETPGSVDIRLKEDPAYLDDPKGKNRYWYVRVINTDIPGRWQSVLSGMGYVPVRVSELQDPGSIHNLHREAGDDKDPVVRMGDKGKQVLVKMPMELYNASKAAQKAARDRRSGNARLVKEELANKAASHFGGLDGSEAADTISDEFQLTLRRSKTTLGAEMSGDNEILDEA